MEHVQAGFARSTRQPTGFARLREWLARRQISASFQRISEQELQDAGLTRADVEAALALPLSRNASQALFAAAESQVSNW